MIRRPLLALFLAAALPAARAADAAVDVDSLLFEYHTLCSNAVSTVQAGLSGNTVSNADDVYLVGWLQAREAIPFLLDIAGHPPRDPVRMPAERHGAAISTPHRRLWPW